MALKIALRSVGAGIPVGRRSIRAFRHSARMGSIRAQRASEMSDGYADRGVMPKLYYAGHARRGRLPYPEVPCQVYARRNPDRSALLNGHNASRHHHTDIPIEAGCAQNALEQKRQTPPNRT